jgi:thiamine biosynthesis lipoprotein
MSEVRRTSRRAFLGGRAALDAAVDLIDRWTAPADDDSASDPTGGAYLAHYGRRAMACQFEVSLNAGQYPHAWESAVAALDLVEQLEAQLTVFGQCSEVLEINRHAATKAVPVEPRLFQLLKTCRELYSATGGAFDITAGPLSKVWGFFRRQGRLPELRDLQAALQCVGSDQLILDDARHTVRFGRQGMELNLGAIGKGYALDRCAERLKEAGVQDLLLHGGLSSVLAAGSRAGAAQSGWVIGVRHPIRPGKTLARIRLQDRALGTSGAANQFFRYQGRRYSHILDPRTGWPAQNVFSCTALAPTAALADALSTAFFVLGPHGAQAYCRDHPEVGALMICSDGETGPVRLEVFGLDESVLELPADQF